jgi:Fe2+ transport system protein FeoA
MTTTLGHVSATASAEASVLAAAPPLRRQARVCPLNCLGMGCTGQVVSVSGERECRRRLLEMGFCNGADVQMMGRAPLGDPVEFKLRGYCLCLREEQAARITVALKDVAMTGRVRLEGDAVLPNQ